jgi:cell division protein FtsB
MNFLNSILATLRNVGAAIAAVFFYHLGKQSEQKKQTDAENDALREEIDRLNSKPVTPDDRAKLFERAKVKARAREKTKP